MENPTLLKQKDRPHVLILLPEDGTGGAERVFWNQVRSFSTFAKITPCLYRKVENKTDKLEGLKPIFLDGRETNSTSALRRFFKRALALNRIVKEHDIDIVISHMDGTNWLNVASLHRKKKLLVVHGTVDHDQNISKLFQIVRKKLIFPFLYNAGNYTIAVSEAIKAELRSHRIKNVIHIPNYFNIEKIRDRSKDPLPWQFEAFVSDNFLLVASGRMATQKNFEPLIEILDNVRGRGIPAKLIILGTGPNQKNIEKKCDEFGLKYKTSDGRAPSHDAVVALAGYCENPFPFVKQADLFLLPSKWEGYPLALCEAMICGTYPVSADCPTGPREIISPGSSLGQYTLSEPEHAAYGTLLPIPVRKCQKDLWAEQICKLLLDPSRRETIGKSAEEHLSQLDEANIIERWRALIM